MTHHVGAQLTALSVPGHGYPYSGFGPGLWYVNPYQAPYTTVSTVGAQLTALSIPGQGNMLGPYFAPYGAGPGYWYVSGPTFREPFRPYGRVFFGAEYPSAVALPERRGLTAALAPIVAPATGGILVRKHLDENQILHVEICVDDMCHRTSMDLGPAISALMGKLKSVHDTWHQSQADEAPPVIRQIVDEAQDLMVGALVGRHVDTVASGILDSITSVIKSVSPLGLVMKIKPVADVLRKFKGPITAAAGIAAAGAATAIPGVGPFVAPIAGKLAGEMVSSSLGDPAAQQKVAQAKQEAATDPAMAAALDAATKAVANTTAAYSVRDTAKRAEAGDPAAQQEIVAVADDAKKGDPAAKAVADMVQSAMTSEWGAKLWEQVTGRGPDTISGWYDITVGADIAKPFLIAVFDEDGNQTSRQVLWHPTHDQIQRFGGQPPVLYTEDEGGLFLFRDPRGDALNPSEAARMFPGRYTTYRPSWQVMYWSDGQASPRTSGTSARYMGPSDVGALIGRDITGQWYSSVGRQTNVGSFWSKVKDGLLTVTLTKQTNQFIKDNNLQPYVQTAANAISMYYGGPAGVAASNVVTPMMMKVGVKDEDPAVEQRIERATAVAQQDPTMARAVDIAKEAATSAATAYQVAALTKDARAGDPAAQKALADLQAAADRGDPDAAAVLQAAAVIDRQRFQNMYGDPAASPPAPPTNGSYGPPPTNGSYGPPPTNGSYGPPPGPPPTVSGSHVGQWQEIANVVIGCGCAHAAVGQWHEIVGATVGAAIDDLREMARAHALTKQGNAAGVLVTTDGRQMGRGFRTLDAAIDWLQHITRNARSFTYAAAYEKDRAGNPYIQAEEFGVTAQPAAVSTPIPRGIATTGRLY